MKHRRHLPGWRQESSMSYLNLSRRLVRWMKQIPPAALGDTHALRSPGSCLPRVGWYSIKTGFIEYSIKKVAHCNTAFESGEGHLVIPFACPLALAASPQTSTQHRPPLIPSSSTFHRFSAYSARASCTCGSFPSPCCAFG
jgi:hypothetical protein